MPTCFVIMPLGQTTQTHTKEYWSEHFEFFIKPAIEGASDGKRLLGYKAELSDPAGGGIIGDVFRNLQEADVVLADLTDFNPNVVYELGIRHCLRDRTIMILEAGLPIPFYFQNYKVIQYSKEMPRDTVHFRESIQRRLFELSQVEPSPWDNPVSDYFRGIGQRVMLVSRQGPDMALPVLRESGFSTIYVPSTNAERNVRKEDVVLEAEQHIKLLATTGHSYLAMVGSRFKGALAQRLSANVPVQVILLNPWTESAVLIALGELSEGPSTEIQAMALELLERGDLVGFDPVALIKDSIYYRHKYPESIEGYMDLKKRFGSSIELRLSEYEIAVTMLLTEKTGFFEPYIHVNLPERMRSLMLTFELEFSSKSYLYPHCIAYFDTLWKLAIPYDRVLATEEKWKAQLRDKYE
jgi:hypothetical protein